MTTLNLTPHIRSFKLTDREFVKSLELEVFESLCCSAEASTEVWDELPDSTKADIEESQRHNSFRLTYVTRIM